MTAIAANSTTNPAPTRYHPAVVALHWVIALLIVVTAYLAIGGGEEGRRLGGATIAGLPILGIHMILGILVLVLLVVRLVIRWRTRQPAWATVGSPILDKVGVVTHWGLYILTFAITITGLILALQTNRLSRVFTPSSAARNQFASGQQQPGQLPPGGQSQPGQSLPFGQFQGGEFPRGGSEGGFARGSFSRGGGFFLGAFHGLSWTLLLLLIVLHVAAALYHQFLRKDNLLGRMWFGRRFA